MSINLKKLISIGVLAVVAGDATAQAGGAAIGASPVPKDAVSSGAVAAATLAAAAAIGIWLSSHTTANHP